MTEKSVSSATSTAKGGATTSSSKSSCSLDEVGILQSSSRSSSTVVIDFSYKVKMINSHKKSDYSVKTLEHSGKFRTHKELVTKLSTSFEVNVDKVGYMLPGHGLKGKHYYIDTDDKISDMYIHFGGKREILLCCWYLVGNQPIIVEDDTIDDILDSENASGPVNIPPKVPPKPKPSKCSESIGKKITEAEDIMKTLGKIHKKYSVEQLSSWAHLIQMGKYHSYDTPPDIPYFVGYKKRGNKSKQQSKVMDSDEEPSSPSKRSCPMINEKAPPTFSPSTKLKVRGECIEQLRKWHELLEKGGITKKQYEEFQKTIMTDMDLAGN